MKRGKGMKFVGDSRIPAERKPNIPKDYSEFRKNGSVLAELSAERMARRSGFSDRFSCADRRS